MGGLEFNRRIRPYAGRSGRVGFGGGFDEFGAARFGFLFARGEEEPELVPQTHSVAESPLPI